MGRLVVSGRGLGNVGGAEGAAAGSGGSEVSERGVVLRWVAIPGSSGWFGGRTSSGASCSLSVLIVVVLVEEPFVAAASEVIFGGMAVGAKAMA